jgi:6-phosphogluconolactonase
MTSSPEIRVLASSQQLFQAAAEQFVNEAMQAVNQRGRFSVALSGGSTPKGLYTLLAGPLQSQVPWQRTFFFWGDERHVPPDHPDSNYRMVSEAMFSRVAAPRENIFRVPAETPDADLAAREYEETIRHFFQLEPGACPRFDLVLLGMGPDGHTASLFPGSAGLQEKSRLVVANWIEKFKAYRITFTLPVINHAACVIFLIAGENKADALHEVLGTDSAGEKFPAKLIHPANGRLIFYIDRAAAAQLSIATQPKAG